VAPAQHGADHPRRLVAASHDHAHEVGEVTRVRPAGLRDGDAAFLGQRERVDVVDGLLGVPGKDALHHLDDQQSVVTLGDSSEKFDLDHVDERARRERGGDPA